LFLQKDTRDKFPSLVVFPQCPISGDRSLSAIMKVKYSLPVRIRLNINILERYISLNRLFHECEAT
jgi:hypothetical protein